MAENELKKPESQQTLPIEEAKKELKELAQTIDPQNSSQATSAELDSVEGRLDMMKLENEGIQEITRQALDALKADIADNNTTFETPLTIKDNKIDVDEAGTITSDQTTESTESEEIVPQEGIGEAIGTTGTEIPKSQAGKPQSAFEAIGKFMGTLAASLGMLFDKFQTMMKSFGKYFDKYVRRRGLTMNRNSIVSFISFSLERFYRRPPKYHLKSIDRNPKDSAQQRLFTVMGLRKSGWV